MNPVSAVVIFIVIWWMVFFMVLPVGIRRAEDLDEGSDPGSPANPRLLLRAGITTAASVVVFLIVFWAVNIGLIDVFGRGQ